jgi:ABC-type transport system involved in multi-copper enzyme maturation permease subunit
MLNIARLKLLEGLMDAKFLFLAVLVVLAFLFNGVAGSEEYRLEREGHLETVAQNTRGLEENSNNLQRLSAYQQRFQAPLSPLAFVAEGGGRMLPNTIVMNAFARFELENRSRGNYKLPLLYSLDWNFIVGGLMALTAIVISFGAVSGEKRQGTLRQVLSNPVSRLKLFIGNYLGLLAVIATALILGVAVNLVIVSFLGGPALHEEVTPLLAWTLVISILYLSVFVLTGVAVSAMTSRPAVALVILLVIWVFAIIAAPGISRLAAERMVTIPSPQQVESEQDRVGDEIWNSYPPIIGRFSGDPFEPQMPMRAEAERRICEARQKIRDDAAGARIRQVLLAQRLASFSPYGLFSDGLQTLCGTGIHGLDQLIRNAERYRNTLHDFVVERDSQDTKSAHLVYGERKAERNTFSTEAVLVSSVPRGSAIWTSNGLSRAQEMPWWQIGWLLVYNLLAGLAAFFAVIRYDPR